MFNTCSLYTYTKNWSYNNTYICRYIHIYLLIWYKDRGRRDTISLLLNLGTQQKCVVNFTPWPLFPWEKKLSTHWTLGWVGPRAILGILWKRKICKPYHDSTLNYPAHTTVITPTTLLWLLENLRWYCIQRNYYMEIKLKDDVEYYTYITESSTILWKYRDKRNIKKMERWFWSCTSLVPWCIKITEAGTKTMFLFH